MKGPFQNKMITFSQRPSWVTLNGKTLSDNIDKIPSIVENTNIEAVFKMILEVAKANALAQEDLPKTLFIISDMEFDPSTLGIGKDYGYRGEYDQRYLTLHKAMKKMYADAGYALPKVVYWKVDNKVSQVQVTKDEAGTAIISGFSPKLLQNVVADASLDPYDMMLQVLNGPRYETVTLGETV